MDFLHKRSHKPIDNIISDHIKRLPLYLLFKVKTLSILLKRQYVNCENHDWDFDLHWTMR